MFVRLLRLRPGVRNDQRLSLGVGWKGTKGTWTEKVIKTILLLL